MEEKDVKTIIIQGAMDSETDYLISKLDDMKEHEYCGYKYYQGTIGKDNVIVSKTNIGTINSTIATTIGIEKFNPNLVINQGIAGAHTKDIHTGDVVIGETCYNINSFMTLTRHENESSNPFEWESDKRAKEIKKADEKYVKKYGENISKKAKSKVYFGTLGSGDIFNREKDRINWLHKKFNTLCEDMESIGTYTVCKKHNVPCIGIRMISNNELLHEELDEAQGLELQKLLLETVIEEK